MFFGHALTGVVIFFFFFKLTKLGHSWRQLKNKFYHTFFGHTLTRVVIFFKKKLTKLGHSWHQLKNKFYHTCHLFFFYFISAMATCQLCQKTFSRTHSLTRHLQEKHRGQSQQKIECQFCIKTFSWPEHALSATPRNSTQPDVRLANNLPVSRMPKQDLQAQRLPMKTPAKMPYPAKDHQSRRTVCNAIFPTRGH